MPGVKGKEKCRRGTVAAAIYLLGPAAMAGLAGNTKPRGGLAP